MKLKVQKRLAAQVLGCSQKRVWFDSERFEELKEAITKVDIRSLIKDNAIKMKPVKGVSKARARKRREQRRKGRQRGSGSRKGKKGARLSKKTRRKNNMRTQRSLLKELVTKKIIEPATYRNLYLKSKGGFFRSRRHIKLYIDEHKLAKK